MSKTIEKLAEEYVAHNRSYPYDQLNAQDRYMKNSYLVGYKAAQRWISVDEKLPELGKPVLCAVRNPAPPIRSYMVEIYYLFSKHKSGDFTFHSGDDENEGFTHFVTHWMELPELPEVPQEVDGRPTMTANERQYVKTKLCSARHNHQLIDFLRESGNETIQPSYEDPESIYYGKKNYD